MVGNPLAGFARLNKLVSFYQPKQAVENGTYNANTQTPPSLIVLCSWAGAAPKHIAKYTQAYQRLYPNTPILLIQSTLAVMFKTADIESALDVVASFRNNDASSSSHTTDTPSIVLHAFSNGGARNADVLATEYLHIHGEWPFDTVILDCCPGKPEVETITKACTYSLPNNPLVRQIGLSIIWVIIFMIMVVHKTFRIEDNVSKLRRHFSDPDIFPGSVPRMYLYSKGDQLVRLRHVHENAEDARRAGYEVVREEVFERAAHCALLNEDAERYWKAVRDHIRLQDGQKKADGVNGGLSG